MSERFPKLLIVSQLVQPLNAANEILGHLATHLKVEHSATLIHGALVMAVAALEVALADSLKYYLRNFPEKVPKDHARTSIVPVPTDMADFVAFLRCARFPPLYRSNVPMGIALFNHGMHLTGASAAPHASAGDAQELTGQGER